jgi:small subunit ribosomal protein S11
MSKIVLQPVKRKSGSKQKNLDIPRGIVHIHATFNNTKVSVTDMNGNVLAWASAGKMGFKGSRKSTAYAAQVTAAEASKRAKMVFNMREAEVQIKGPGAGRESAVRGVVAAGLDIVTLRDVTPVPHNGCRPPKRRRV